MKPAASPVSRISSCHVKTTDCGSRSFYDNSRRRKGGKDQLPRMAQLLSHYERNSRTDCAHGRWTQNHPLWFRGRAKSLQGVRGAAREKRGKHVGSARRTSLE